MLEALPAILNIITEYCREYLIKYSEPGSDVGLCVAEWDKVNSATQTFGKQAKEKVLTQAEALSVAKQAGLFLEGLTGTKEGIIGALAAVGLRKSGNDGRFLWVPGLYEVSSICTVRQLYQTASIDRIQDLEGNLVSEDTKIKTSPWPRPVLIDGQAVMLVVKTIDNSHQVGEKNYEYEMAPKNVIRRY